MIEYALGEPEVYLGTTYVTPTIVVEYNLETDSGYIVLNVSYNITHFFVQEPYSLADNPDDYYGYEEIDYNYAGMTILDATGDEGVKKLLTDQEEIDQVLSQIDEDFEDLDQVFINILKKSSEEALWKWQIV
jgi:hypothetical protein